jgi:hypothetical protein
MNIIKKERTSLPKKQSLNSGSNAQPINLYQEIPNMEVSLDDFEEFALDRLKVCYFMPLFLGFAKADAGHFRYQKILLQA